MIYFNNLVRDLKKRISNFILDSITYNCNRKTKKFLVDLVWGILSSNSTKISDIARTLHGSKAKINENRLSLNLNCIDLSKVKLNYFKYVFHNLAKFNPSIIVDETDVVKPFGIVFEGLNVIRDGSNPNKQKEKGWPVTGIITLTDNDYVIPLSLHIYSSVTKNHKSIFEETKNNLNEIFPNIIKDNILTVVFDRGYDSNRYMNYIKKRGLYYIIRAKTSRKYTYNKRKLTINEISKLIKGKYDFSYVNKNKEHIFVKATPIRMWHEDIQGCFTLLFEYINKEKEPRVYITNLDCDNKEEVKRVLKNERLRWRIEEYYRFIKQIFGMEKFMIRRISAINNLFFCIILATTFITEIIQTNDSLYRSIIEVYQPLNNLKEEQKVEEELGYHGLKLYRVARGLKTILGHSKERIIIPGRIRKKKEELITLF